MSDEPYFSGIAGNLLSVRLVGSIVIPTDPSAVTPKIGSTLSGPKITRPAVVSFINEISARPNSLFLDAAVGEFVSRLAD